MVVGVRYNNVQNHAMVRLSDRQDDTKLMSDPYISEVSNNTVKYLHASGQILFAKFLAFTISEVLRAFYFKVTLVNFC